VTARVRFADLRSVTRSVTLPAAVSVTPIIAEVAESLVRSALHDHPDVHEVSLLAVGVSGLAMESALQLELPLHLEGERIRPGTEAGSSRWVLDKAVDEVREKFGKRSIGYASVVLDESRAVPDEFRELAEH
jgi:DNA polymerase-4